MEINKDRCDVFRLFTSCYKSSSRILESLGFLNLVLRQAVEYSITAVRF